LVNIRKLFLVFQNPIGKQQRSFVIGHVLTDGILQQAEIGNRLDVFCNCFFNSIPFFISSHLEVFVDFLERIVDGVFFLLAFLSQASLSPTVLLNTSLSGCRILINGEITHPLELEFVFVFSRLQARFYIPGDDFERIGIDEFKEVFFLMCIGRFVGKQTVVQTHFGLERMRD
jgi:hypothetical protein